MDARALASSLAAGLLARLSILSSARPGTPIISVVFENSWEFEMSEHLDMLMYIHLTGIHIANAEWDILIHAISTHQVKPEPTVRGVPSRS